MKFAQHTKHAFAAFTAALFLAACQSTPPAQGTYVPKSATRGAVNETAAVRVALAGEYIKQGNLDMAMRQINMALDSDARYAPAYDVLGVLLHRDGTPTNLVRADEAFRRSLALDPAFTRARNNYGVFLADQGRLGEALAQFEVAATTLGYDGRGESLINLGLTYKKTGQDALAKAQFEKALNVTHNSAVARIELLDYALNQGDYLVAKGYLDEVTYLYGAEPMPARVYLLGIKTHQALQEEAKARALSAALLSRYPLSDEAKAVRQSLRAPN